MSARTTWNKTKRRVKRAVRDQVLAAIGYEGATSSRRSTNWQSNSTAPDDLIRYDIAMLRERSRAMARNHWAAKRALDVLSAHVVGSGIMPSCRHNDEFDAWLDAWSRPQSQVGTQKGHSLGAVQRLAFATAAVSGSALVLRRWRTPRQIEDRGLVMPFQLQVLEPEFLDTTKDGKIGANRVVHGIEYDATDWPVAYHLHKRHPGELLYSSTGSDSVRVPAADVSHVFWQQRPGQTLGVPWFHAVLVKMRDFDDYEDAQLLRQKIAAMFVAFVRSGLDSDGSPRPTDPIELAPGRLQFLADDEEITFSAPPKVEGFADYSHVTLRSIAAGIGLTYEDLAGDYSHVNFSSARMGSLVAKTLVETWQNEMMIGQFCSDVERWIAEAADLVNIEAHDIAWTAPPRELIDPSREVSAIERKIAAGLTSRQAEIRKLGYDVDDIDAERAQDKAREEQLGLVAETPGEEPVLFERDTQDAAAQPH